MEGTVIKRLRERSFSRSFRHPSPPIFKSLLMARTHASFSRVLGEKSAKSASLSLSLVLLCPSSPSSTQVKVPNGENGNGPDANKTKSSSRFPPRFRLSTPLINSSLFAFRRVLPAFISQVFGKGDQNSAGSLPTPHTCVAPPSINVACLSRAPLSSSSPLCPPTKILRLAMPRQLFVYRAIFFSFLSKLKIFITQGTRFRASYYTCRSLASKLKLKFESLLRFFARTGNCYDSLRVFSTKYRARFFNRYFYLRNSWNLCGITVKISPLIRSNVEEKNGRINNIMENNSFLALYRML